MRKNEKQISPQDEIVRFDPDRNSWIVSANYNRSTDTMAYQEVIFQQLKKFSPSGVKKEWSVSSESTDVFRHKGIYAPRLDIAVGPFNTKIETFPKVHQQISLTGWQNPIIKRILSENKNLQVNTNPRCLLAIEISFSGSSKHILGDFTNASMMGLVGVIVARKRNYNRVLRIKNYLEVVRDLGKAPSDLFKNLVVYKIDDFLNILY